jgi:flagellar hook assembly protein FlgD
VAFVGTSNQGNSLYLDDVMIGQSPTSVVDAGILAGNVSVFPNPSEGPVQIQLDLEEAVTATIHVVYMTGRLVHTVSSAQSLPSGTHQFDWTGNVSNGVYMVKILTDKGQVTERVTIAR